MRTDLPTVLHSGSLSYARSSDDWVLTNTRLFGDTVENVYLEETPKVKNGEFEVVETWRLASPERRPAVPLRPGVPARPAREGSQQHVVKRKQLATVDEEYHVPGEADEYVTYLDAFRSISGGYVPVGDIEELAAPGRLTHYLTANPDVRLRQTVVHPDGTRWFHGTPMASATEARTRGSRTVETWFETGLRPGVPSRRRAVATRPPPAPAT